MYEYVFRREVAPANELCTALLQRACARLKEGLGIRIRIVCVGSSTARLVTRDGAGARFDVDYDLRVRENSLGGLSPLELKLAVRNAVDAEADELGFEPGRDSTSCITYLHRDPHGAEDMWGNREKSYDFSLDVGVIVVAGDRPARRVINRKELGVCVLEESMDLLKVKADVKKINRAGGNQRLRKIYLAKKNARLSAGDETHPSHSLLREAVNETSQSLFG